MNDLEDLMSEDKAFVEDIKISFIDVPSAISLVVFFNGCSIKCIDCQNCQFQKRDENKIVSIKNIVNYLNSKTLNNWICFQGGEPFDQPDSLFKIISLLNKNVAIYTGYSDLIVFRKFKHITSLKCVKFIKTGRYMKERTIKGKFLITSNQKVFVKRDDNFFEFDWLNDKNNSNLIKIIESICPL
jgi:organic radical activating enzyme